MCAQSSKPEPRQTRRQWLQDTGLTLGAAVLSSRGLAQGTEPAKTRPDFDEAIAYLNDEMAAGTFPGALLAVSQHGQPLLNKTWGTYCSRNDRSVPCESSTIHMCYSVSKLIASTVVAIARQSDKFDYTTPISKFIPEFTGGGKESINVRHLLTHSAGLPAVPLTSVDTTAKWDSAVRTLCAAKVDWEPGSRTMYHGLTGHFLAAEVARRTTGARTWEELCQSLLCGPIGARSLTYQIPPEAAPVAGTPQPPQGSYNFSAFEVGVAGHPAGGAFATADDLLKVLQLHLNGGTWEGRTLLEPENFRDMHTVQYAREIAAAEQSGKPPAHEPWGLGILLRGPGAARGAHGWFGMAEIASPQVFGHAGIDTIIAVGDPQLDAAVVFLTTDSPKPMPKVAPLRSLTVAKALGALG